MFDAATNEPKSNPGGAGPRAGASVSGRSVFQGGVTLGLRQLAGYGLKIIGLFLITRVLGPGGYAPFVAANVLIDSCLSVLADGMNAHLVLGGPGVTVERERAVQGILLTASLLLAGLVFVFAGALAAYMNIPAARGVMMVLALAVPLRLLLIPAFARLERALDYRRIAAIELLGQVTYYAVGAPLVLSGFGAMGLAIGLLAQSAVALTVAIVATRFVPRPLFDRRLTAEILRFGFAYSVVSWTWQMRGLVNPLVIGPVLGPTALGIVGMATTVVELTAFIKNIVYRISLSVLGRAREDAPRMRAALTSGLQVQTLAVGTVLLGFSWFDGYLVPFAFGPDWMPILPLYPFIALSFLANAQFNVHAAVLIALGRQREVVLFHLAHVALFIGVAALAVPRLGIIGYGYGELAALPAYLLLHVFVARRVGSPDYAVGLMWLAGAGLGLFWRELGAWAIAAPFVALAMPASVRLIALHVDQIFRHPEVKSHA